MLRYQLKNTIYTPAMAAAILVQCFFMMVGLYPKANADMVYNLQQSMTLGYGWLFISVTSVVPLCFSFTSAADGRRFIWLFPAALTVPM